MSDSDCKRMNGYHKIKPGMICAGGEEGKDSCQVRVISHRASLEAKAKVKSSKSTTNLFVMLIKHLLHTILMKYVRPEGISLYETLK